MDIWFEFSVGFGCLLIGLCKGASHKTFDTELLFR